MKSPSTQIRELKKEVARVNGFREKLHRKLREVADQRDQYRSQLAQVAEAAEVLRVVQGGKSGAALIFLERCRQVEVEEWTAKHDDGHKQHELALAAISYVSAVASPDESGWNRPCYDWPWTRQWWKPSRSPVRNLVKAGALIAAEIDRLRRKEQRARRKAQGARRER